jgi:hypothetical protein
MVLIAASWQRCTKFGDPAVKRPDAWPSVRRDRFLAEELAVIDAACMKGGGRFDG